MASITQNCTTCKKPFLIIDQEQQFLKEKDLSLPTMCPGCRQMRRLSLRGSERALFRTKCQKCGKEIIVAFDPQKVTNAILCQADYDQYFTENDPIIQDPLPEI